MWIRRTALAALVVSPVLLIGSAGVSAAKTSPTRPTITVQPASTTMALGRQAHFQAKATGSPRPTYQWQVSTGGATFVDVGRAGTGLSVAATFATDGNRYRAVISNSQGDSRHPAGHPDR